jgi:Protein of unknown function (DUF3300)
MKLLQQGMALFLSWCLILIGGGEGFAYQTNPPASQPPQAVLETPQQLQQLVAPIALYPDGLVAQILAAATYPDQIVAAGSWMNQHKNLQGDRLAKEVDKQPWDASVKALTQFPAVLANMNQNLAWTSELGDAYINQQQDVSQAVQTMRQRAQQAGNLKTTPQETVTNQGSTIVIQPAVPDVVYVPQYDPWLVYGGPIAVFPGWYPYAGLYLGGPGIAFGLGFGIGVFGGFGWGWHNWGYDWHGGGRVLYGHNTYISHSDTIVNRSSFRGNGMNFNNRGNFRNTSNFRGNAVARGSNFSHSSATRSGAFSGFRQGGVARTNSFRGQSSFGGFRGGGGFHGGGFHGGGGRR